MSFSKARLHRFNEEISCAPPPGTYDPKYENIIRGGVIRSCECVRPHRRIRPSSSLEGLSILATPVTVLRRKPMTLPRNFNPTSRRKTSPRVRRRLVEIFNVGDEKTTSSTLEKDEEIAKLKQEIQNWRSLLSKRPNGCLCECYRCSPVRREDANLVNKDNLENIFSCFKAGDVVKKDMPNNLWTKKHSANIANLLKAKAGDKYDKSFDENIQGDEDLVTRMCQHWVRVHFDSVLKELELKPTPAVKCYQTDFDEEGKALNCSVQTKNKLDSGPSAKIYHKTLKNSAEECSTLKASNQESVKNEEDFLDRVVERAEVAIENISERDRIIQEVREGFSESNDLLESISEEICSFSQQIGDTSHQIEVISKEMHAKSENFHCIDLENKKVLEFYSRETKRLKELELETDKMLTKKDLNDDVIKFLNDEKRNHQALISFLDELHKEKGTFLSELVNFRGKFIEMKVKLAQQITEYSHKLDQLELSNDNADTFILEMSMKIEKLEHKVSKYSHKLDMMEIEWMKNKKVILRLEEESRDSAEEKARLIELVETQNKTIGNLKKELEEMNKVQQDMKEKARRQVKLLEEAKEETRRLQEVLSSWEERYRDLQEDQVTLIKKLVSLEANLSCLTSARDNFQSQLKDINLMSSLLEEKLSLEGQLKEELEPMPRLKEKVAELEVTVEEQKATIDRLKEELQLNLGLKDMVKDLEVCVEEQKAILEQFEREKIFLLEKNDSILKEKERFCIMEVEKQELEMKLGHVEEEKKELEVKLGQLELEKKELEANKAKLEAEKQELETIIGPYRDQLVHFVQERNLLLSRAENTEKELCELGLEHARSLGHSNAKQKIKYMVKLKEANNHLKKELEQLRLENLTLRNSSLSRGGSIRKKGPSRVSYQDVEALGSLPRASTS